MKDKKQRNSGEQKRFQFLRGKGLMQKDDATVFWVMARVRGVMGIAPGVQAPELLKTDVSYPSVFCPDPKGENNEYQKLIRKNNQGKETNHE